MDLITVVASAVSGLVGSVLTYLATRQQAMVSERSVYVGALDQLTTGLRREIERLGQERDGLLAQLEALEQRLSEHEALAESLQQRVDELEASERQLKKRIEQLETERDRLKAQRDRLQERIEGIAGYTTANPEDDESDHQEPDAPAG